MSKNLLLVESPSKAKTIKKYLGRNYIVEATVGHVRNLPKTKLGIDIDDNFKFHLLNIRGKGDLINKIRKLSAKVEYIYIATDPDREGEAIAQDIYDLIKSKTKAKVYRVLFNEITKQSVKKAMKNPLEIDASLVNSQRARRAMDRIIGYKISPLLWRAILEHSGNSLSAGRVQSVALRLICEKEDKIDSFIPTEYWSIIAEFKTDDGKTFQTKLFEIDGKQIKIPPKPKMDDSDWEIFLKKYVDISSEKEANNILTRIKDIAEFKISSLIKKEQKKNPPPPFITSTLQAEASRLLRFRPRRTMRIAQSLYEGVDLGKEGTTGLITYMRTDSTRLNSEIVNETRDLIEKNFGKEYKPDSPRSYEKKKKNVQDAHEAIRPTSLKYKPEKIKNFLNDDQFKLYNIIWKRFIACQMESAIQEITTVTVSGKEFLFKNAGTALKFDGFLKVYNAQPEGNGEAKEVQTNIPSGLEKGMTANLIQINKNQHFTKPPARYTESTLIKELESNGIGRPSTYALVIGTIQDRNYVVVKERKLFPTELGRKVNSVLVKNFPEILNVNFTAKMEDELDLIASGDNSYQTAMNDFYGPFSKSLEIVENNLEKIICEKCGSEMEIRIGRYGKYLACMNPECKNIQSLRSTKQNTEPEYTGKKCPECGKRLVYRHGKFGDFIGCENYPECKYTEQITLNIKCPKCGIGEVVTRRAKSGRVFYGCSRYPDCDFVSWTKPKDETISAESEK
ncbi:DNA topoisomerase 1 [bacterium BMS3Abin04]|nr:DNA topoisomerase 1 [bacterium BMS3Abin04]